MPAGQHLPCDLSLDMRRRACSCSVTKGQPRRSCNDQHRLAIYQGRAEASDPSLSIDESALREECMQELKAAAAVMEAAVGTVAAAAEDGEQRQPLKNLVTVCCDAARAMLGAYLSGSAAEMSVWTSGMCSL